MNIASRSIWDDIALIPSPFTHLLRFQTNTCEVHEQKRDNGKGIRIFWALPKKITINCYWDVFIWP